VHVVVVGAGVIGAACAEALSAAGVTVTVVDRTGPAAGTTGAGEGNVLVSDKEPGPELELAQASRRQLPTLLTKLAEELGQADVEWQPKGGLVVATTDPRTLHDFAARQREAGVMAQPISAQAQKPVDGRWRKAIAATTAVPSGSTPVTTAACIASTWRTASPRKSGKPTTVPAAQTASGSACAGRGRAAPVSHR